MSEKEFESLLKKNLAGTLLGADCKPEIPYLSSPSLPLNLSSIYLSVFFDLYSSHLIFRIQPPILPLPHLYISLSHLTLSFPRVCKKTQIQTTYLA